MAIIVVVHVPGNSTELVCPGRTSVRFDRPESFVANGFTESGALSLRRLYDTDAEAAVFNVNLRSGISVNRQYGRLVG